MKKITGYKIHAIVSVDEPMSEEKSNELLDKMDDLLEQFGFSSIVLSPIEEDVTK